MKTILIAVVGLVVAGTVPADDWPAWRGPFANGYVPGGVYPTRWSAETATWKVELPGKGASTPIVWQNRIYLTTPADGHDAVMALDMNGKQLWLTKLGPASPPRHKTLGTSCNSSPVTDGKAVFVRFRSGTLAALEFDGRVRWQINLVERFGPEVYIWDQGSSPVVTERDVIYARMHNGDSWVAGFDKATGEMRWQVKRNYDVPVENDNGYTTPVFFLHQGRLAFLLWGADHLTAHDAADGKLIWSCGGFNPDGTGYWPAIATPVIVNGIAVVPVGRDDRKQGRMEGVRVDGRGDVTATHRVWKRDDFGIFCCSPAVWQGRVYLLRPLGEVVCIDPATGKSFWAEALPRGARFFASPLVANGVLYAAREDGVVFTARVGNRLELLGENPLRERLIASPVAVNNRLLFRGDKHLFCIAGK
ncbi:MAG: PQQ-binding-like beta-propeller repeat protein [Verrucomicrobiae bacterium]|nr:PQQ-binding-like beta-propeller repeat protein [Verrucomicrobiae bacterium]